MENLSHRTTNIVLADDDDDDFLFLKSATDYASSPVYVSHVLNWLELLRFLNKPPLPDIIFLDLNMPVRNGLECLASLREERRYDKICIIIYSTSGSQKDIDEAYRLGANYYLVKPSSQTEITNAVDKICAMDMQKLITKPDKEKFVLTA
jgi:CheY-like chemotaxis protein